jgi:hypothetical protein
LLPGAARSASSVNIKKGKVRITIMTAAIYQCGDTIQVTESFYSFAGILANLNAAPSVKMYGADKTTQSGATKPATLVSTGIYSCALTLPTTEGLYYIQFSGTATDGTAVSHTEEIFVKFSSST